MNAVVVGLLLAALINPILILSTKSWIDIAIVFILFAAVLSSFVRVFLNHFNLVVYIKKAVFEISQGLTTKKSIVLRKEKVQHITVKTNPLKKILGIACRHFL